MATLSCCTISLKRLSNKSRIYDLSSRTLFLIRQHESPRRRQVPCLSVIRWNSNSNNKGSKFQLDALPFSVSPEEALKKWKKWAEDDQSLKYLLNYNSIRIGAAYCPVWSFDSNIQFPNNSIPPLFKSAYQSSNSSTIYLPGLSAYAGYSYRRSLVNPVHSTSLVFMGEQTVPFGSWMLRDMVLNETGSPISIVPDAWTATKGRAFQVVKQELQSLVDAAWTDNNSKTVTTQPPKVKIEVVKARRVYMPTFVIDYKILGLEYRAFVSGCDQGAAVTGVSHVLFGDFNNNIFVSPEYYEASKSFLSTGLGILRREPRLVSILAPLIRKVVTAVWFLAVRFLTKIPVIGVAGGFLAGYRKVYQPWMDNQRASAEWERQREHEAQMDEDDGSTMFHHQDNFIDPQGRARSYFFRHKARILNDLGGDLDHEQGEYGWFQDWQEWANRQWQQQQRQQHQQQQQQQYRQQQSSSYSNRKGGSSSSSSSRKSEYHWDFDPNDPYSVLGLRRGNASKEQVSQAFRQQMLKYHPDTQPNATPAQKQRLVERSKLITEAYRKIKSEQKRS